MDREAVLTTARVLSVDQVTLEVADAFDEAGIEALVLKGPVLSRALYRDGTMRSYGDSDFLISPNDELAAHGVLSRLGFRRYPTTLPAARPPKATEWVRDRDRAVVDLHTTLPLLGVTPADAWTVLSEAPGAITIGGREIKTLSDAGIAFHVALHALGHGIQVDKPLEDLRRACAAWSTEVWRAAAAVAERLRATDPFSAGLRLVPQGAAIAERLALPRRVTPELALLASSAPRFSFEGVAWVAEQDSFGKKLAIVLSALAPPHDVLRTRYAFARRGRIGLALSVVVHIAGLLWGTPRAYLAWRRARRAAR